MEERCRARGERGEGEAAQRREGERDGRIGTRREGEGGKKENKSY